MKPPADILHIEIGGEPQRIKMTYGLVTDLSRLLPDARAVTDMLESDPNLRDLVVRRVLTKDLKQSSRMEDLIAPEDLDVAVGDLADVVVFAAEHVLYFFMSTATKTAAVVEKYKATMTPPSDPSTTGSPN